ncbi:MAG TPA: iron-sulfur cluster repair di-iron protein [Gaiellaceae bacterium]|nr:iron-sulfur cluster repair di-iron protein [Gaiellaceae bacterium]
MDAIDPESTTVAELVLARPSRARVLERLGIDYCCGGRQSLSAACARRNLDVGAVLSALDAPPDSSDGELEDWTRSPLGILCDHIVTAHHGSLRSELPRLSTLLEKVERAHADRKPELHETRAVFERLRDELEEHMAKEEQVFFPACRSIEETGQAPAFVHAARLVLEHDHDEAGAALQRLSELTHGYDADLALCNTHRALLDGLHELELDLHQHIHEENNILFPRALEAAGVDTG